MKKPIEREIRNKNNNNNDNKKNQEQTKNKQNKHGWFADRSEIIISFYFIWLFDPKKKENCSKKKSINRLLFSLLLLLRSCSGNKKSTFDPISTKWWCDVDIWHKQAKTNNEFCFNFLYDFFFLSIQNPNKTNQIHFVFGFSNRLANVVNRCRQCFFLIDSRLILP